MLYSEGWPGGNRQTSKSRRGRNWREKVSGEKFHATRRGRGERQASHL